MTASSQEGSEVEGLRIFNIVVVGENFPVEKVTPEEFTFHGTPASSPFRIPQMVQAQANEYSLQILPDRFQVAATSSKATQYRVEALVAAASYFIDEFTSKRSVIAVGHNFTGIVDTADGDADSFMRKLSLPQEFESILGSVEAPRQSVTTVFKVDEEAAGQVKLEPSTDEPGRLFFDANISWNTRDVLARVGGPDGAVKRFGTSTEVVGSLISKIARLRLESR